MQLVHPFLFICFFRDKKALMLEEMENNMTKRNMTNIIPQKKVQRQLYIDQQKLTHKKGIYSEFCFIKLRLNINSEWVFFFLCLKI